MYTKKLRRMHQPPSDLTKYDNEGYMTNPLLKFHIADVHENRHFSLLKQKAAIQKVRQCREQTSAEADIRLLPLSHYVDNLRREVRKIDVPKMLTKTEKKILSFAPERLKKKYPELVDSYMKDVHDEHDRLMKIYSMKCILVNPAFGDEDLLPIPLSKEAKCLGIHVDKNHIFLK